MKPKKQHKASRKHYRVPPPRNLPIDFGTETPTIRACACGAMMMGENAEATFADHLAEKRGLRVAN